VDVERVALRAQVNEMFNKSRSSAGSRTIQGLLNDQGVEIGRFKVRRLMGELGLVCKQPGPHAYKRATVERLDIPNRLDREFDVSQPDQVWCGDITYIWTGQRWSYLAVVLDLCARRVVGWAMSDTADAELVVQALDHAWEQRGRPEKVMFHSDSKNVLASVSMWSDSHSDRPMMDDLVVERLGWPDPHSDRPLCLSLDLSTIREHCTSR